jgi:hypothetical protein
MRAARDRILRHVPERPAAISSNSASVFAAPFLRQYLFWQTCSVGSEWEGGGEGQEVAGGVGGDGSCEWQVALKVKVVAGGTSKRTGPSHMRRLAAGTTLAEGCGASTT